MPPPQDRVERRLAAIFAADVAGYSRLMSQDEVGTLRTLTQHREIMDRLIIEHAGRIANTAGDSVLAEFPSAVDAVKCAVAVQEALAKTNQNTLEERRIRFRIGVHVGDVMIRGSDLLGDGVNIAARLESLAEPGGVCISAATHEHVRKSLSLNYMDLGPQPVKNIEEPIRVFTITLTSIEPASAQIESRSKTLPLPDKPSIAILPFDNMSADPEQEYFADGIVEDITAALSRVRSFFVIARNSTFTYKKRAVQVQQVSRELGVRYVVEGSVRRAGGRVRITAQLIDATTGAHLWADHYDGTIEDVFDLQDNITASVVGAIQPSVRAAEIERAKRKRPGSLDAYDLVMRALPHVWALEKDQNRQATGILRDVLGLDPTYPTALSLLSWCCAQRVVYNWSEDIAQEKQETLRIAQQAAALSSDDPFVLAVLGAALSIACEFRQARAMLEKALALDPNSAFAWTRSGWLRNFQGDPETAIQHFERSLRLSPFEPMAYNCLMGIGTAHFIAGRYEQAVEWQEKALDTHPSATWILRGLVPAHVFAGHVDRAKVRLHQLLQAYPDLTVSKIRAALAFNEDYTGRMIEGLRRAGLAE
nr:adenylate/guanylate cyclase domain-containing protein [Microvirga aerophila]